MSSAELIAVARAAVAMFDPARMELELDGLLDPKRKVHILALGKAAAPMAANAAARLGRRVKSTTLAGPEQGSHPIPDERSVAAGEALLAAARAAHKREQILALISGGGSALACVPAPGLTLVDQQRATSQLLGRGASIDEINTARKHLSRIKGGQLAAASAAPVYSLILSDVISGDLGAVASGPTLPDPTTAADARAVIERYDLDRALCERLVETPKRIDGAHRCLADNFELTCMAIEMSGGAGIDEPLAGDVAAVAARLAGLGEGRWVGGGEPTMTLPESPGRGGRMTHLALLLARDLAGTEFAAVCVGSDGVDGNSGASGAAVDGETWSRIGDGGAGDEAIARADSATALARAGALIEWGPTGTNLADLVLIERR